eukprot:Opistho-1_new@19053
MTRGRPSEQEPLIQDDGRNLYGDYSASDSKVQVPPPHYYDHLSENQSLSLRDTHWAEPFVDANRDEYIDLHWLHLQHQFVRRFIASVALLPKFALDGAGWQAAYEIAIRSGKDVSDWELHALTGAGSGIGVFIAHFLTSIIASACNRKERGPLSTQWGRIIFESFHLGVAAAFAGTLWQPAVNRFYSDGFYTTGLMTGLICGTAFLAAFTFGRLVVRGLLQCGVRSLAPEDRRHFWEDAKLSLWTVFWSSFAFVLTSFDTPFRMPRKCAGDRQHMQGRCDDVDWVCDCAHGGACATRSECLRRKARGPRFAALARGVFSRR